MKNLKWMALLASASLIACGGGGGNSGGNTSPSGIPPASSAAPLTANNFGGVAGPSAASVLASVVVADGTDVIRSSSDSVGKFSGKTAYSPYTLANWAISTAKYKSKISNDLVALAVTTQSEACPGGGSLTVSFDDADNNNDLSAGDTLSLSTSNCVIDVGQPALNGSFSLRVNAISYTAAGDIANASLTMSFNNLISAGNTMNGAVTVAISSSGVTNTYQNFSNARGNSAPAILNFTSTIDTAGQLRTSGLITVNNSTYTLSTPTPISIGSFYPIAGILRITDAAGARIDVISNANAGGSLDCDLYLPGDNTLDGRISSTWAAL
jgi:hypothetical protein